MSEGYEEGYSKGLTASYDHKPGGPWYDSSKCNDCKASGSKYYHDEWHKGFQDAMDKRNEVTTHE